MNHMKIGTPLRIEVLMHYFVTDGGYQFHPRMDAPAVVEAHDEFYLSGALILQERNAVPQITPLGRAWVRALCNVTVPQQRFVDEQGRALES